MRKLLALCAALVMMVGFASCEAESTQETDSVYAIDKKDVHPPGDKNGN